MTRFEKPVIIPGSSYTDERGTLSFVNEWDMSLVKRFYIIDHSRMEAIRAWQGHRKEEKYFYVLRGGFRILLVKPDNWINPSADLPVEEFILREKEKRILHIPGGYASGIQSTEPDSQLLVFGTLDLNEATGDYYRFPLNLWYNWDL